ncbi:MAG: hypothetical protein ACI9Z9_002350, partial [Litorivivens sp.]
AISGWGNSWHKAYLPIIIDLDLTQCQYKCIYTYIG